MPESFHCDKGSILKHEYTADGFLRVYGRVAKVGDLIYRDGNKQRVEYVSPDVLFAKDSMDSLKMVPITLGHPSEPVTPINAREHQRGMTGHSVIVDGDFLGVTMTITDRQTIDAIVNGEAQELSCGYKAQVRPRNDSPNHYDQVTRIYNHVAAVPRGRAGSAVRFKIDGIDSDEVWVGDVAIESEKEISKPIQEKDLTPPVRRDSKPMARIFTINNEQISIEDALVAEKFQWLMDKASSKPETVEDTTRIDSLSAELADVKAKLSAAEGKVIGLESQLAEASKRDDAVDAESVVETKMDADEIASEVSARLDAWLEVLPRMPKEYKADSALSSSDIYRAYLTIAHPELKLDGRDAAFVQGVYEGLSFGAANKAESVRAELNEKRADGVSAKPPYDASKPVTLDSSKRKRALPGMAK